MEVEVTLIATEAACPGCRGDLHRLDVPYVLVAPCMRCGGVWLDRPAAEQVASGKLPLECKAFIRQHGARAAESDAAAGYRAPAVDMERVCPVCRQGLREMKAENQGLALDVCGEHGTFFDRGELRAIHESVIAKMTADQEEYEALAAAQWHTRLYGWIYGRDHYKR
jgi:Zn-finger nucleic acid-binding protein